ncbi:MAG: fibronectin type III domain-containing protein, partial [Deltaproteobacteria bacterium]|nr:fibronectin type III domain-containing protein [Deltaproteobacteria bacterium]
STTFFYVVRAANAAGTSTDSAQASATTHPPATAPPATPSGVTATGGVQQIAISWTASTGTTSYIVLKSSSASGTFTQLATPTSTSATDSGLADHATFFYAVQAVGSGGTSASSTPVSATTAPAAPTGLTASATGADVNLAWAGSAGAAGYVISRSLTSNGTYAQIGTASTATYTDTTASPGVTTFYEVSATDGTTTGAASAFASATTQPATPTNVVATPGNTQAVISWTASTGASVYEVRMSTTSGTGFAFAGTSTASPLTISGLTNDTKYFFIVRASNAAGDSGFAGEVNCTPRNVLAAPTVSVSAVGDGSVTLTWTSVSGAVGYAVHRGTSAGGESTTNYLDRDASLTYTDNTAFGSAPAPVNGTTYFYYVRSRNTQGYSLPSNEVSATPIAALNPPAGVAGVARNGGAYLSWSAIGQVDSYNVRRKSGGGAYGAPMSTATASFADTGLTNGTAYTYEVSAVRSGTESGQSAEVTITPEVQLCVGSEALAITAFDAGATGDADIHRTFGSPALTPNPWGLVYDSAHDELIALNTASNSITSFNRTDSGQLAPKRLLAGVNTLLDQPLALSYSPKRDELFVADLTANKMLVFPRLASTSTAPTRTVTNTFAAKASAVAVDDANNRLWTAYSTGGGSTLAQFDIAASGTSTPIKNFTFAISGANRQPSLSIGGAKLYLAQGNQATGVVSLVRFATTSTGAAEAVTTLSGFTDVVAIQADTVNNRVILIGTGVAAGSGSTSTHNSVVASVPVNFTSGTSTPTAMVDYDGINPAQSVAYDSTHGEIVMGTAGLKIYADAGSVNRGPTRVIGGYGQGYALIPSEFASDASHQVMWSIDFTQGVAATYPLATATQNPVNSTPLTYDNQSFIGGGFAVDSAHQTLLFGYYDLAQFGGGVYAFDATQTGPVTPAAVSPGFDYPFNLWFDADHQELFAVTGDSVVAMSRSATSSLYTITRTITGANTTLASAEGIWVQGEDLVVTNGGQCDVLFFNRTDDGDVAPRFTGSANANIIAGCRNVIGDATHIYVGADQAPNAHVDVFQRSNGAYQRSIYPRGIGASIAGLDLCN